MAQTPPHPSLGDQTPADQYPGLPIDQSAGAPAYQPQDVTAARSVGKPAEQLLTTTPADQPRPLPAAETPAAMPADRNRPLPAAEPPAVMPADQSRPVPAAEPPATMPADQAQPVPAAEPPAAMPADQAQPVLAGEPPAVMPADQSRPVLAAKPTAAMPADLSRPVPAAKPTAAMPADLSRPVLAAKPTAAMPADQPVEHVRPASSASPPPLSTNPSLATPSAHARPPASPTVPADRPRHPSGEHPRLPALPASPHGSCGPPPADTVSVADTVSLYGQVDSVSMYGTAESLLQDDGSSLGSDSELNGSTASSQRTDKYGFLGGTQFCGRQDSEIPVDVARQREVKWLEMLRRWDKWVARRFEKVKLRCRKGIPSSLRAQAWQQLSHSKQLMEQNPGKFEDLDRQQGDPKWLDIIEKDLHRQFPFHEMFALRGGHGQQDLYRILKAYTIYRPEEGYCQAQAPVAAVLLMHMPAEQAFWCLVQICEKYLPGYYSAGLEAIQLDGEIFFALLRRVSPLAYRHLQKFKIDPILYMTEWFMCIYSRTLPWSTVLRVWDMFFCDGVKVIFKVGLVLLRYTLGSTDKLRDCQGMYETMEKLRSIPAQYLQEDFLVQEVTSLKVSEALIERENQRQRRRWMENRGELQHRPSRRLYGARAIGEELSRLNPPLSSSPSLLSLTASLASLRRGGREERHLHQRVFRAPSPTHSVSSLVLGLMVGAPPPTGPAISSPALGRPQPLPLPQPGPVVSEGLRPSLPSPTSSVSTFGESGREERKRDKEREKERARADKERARANKERARAEKEQARADKERARRESKEREREHRLLKGQHRKGAKKENGAKDGSATPRSTPAEPNSSSTILKDGYF